MSEYHSLSHSKWDCKYHLVFIPKNRRKIFYGNIRKEIGEIFHELAKQKGCAILEGHLMPDHVHMCIEIPPKHAVSSIVGYIEGKTVLEDDTSRQLHVAFFCGVETHVVTSICGWLRLSRPLHGESESGGCISYTS